jgi:hypothetical protein
MPTDWRSVDAQSSLKSRYPNETAQGRLPMKDHGGLEAAARRRAITQWLVDCR